MQDTPLLTREQMLQEFQVMEKLTLEQHYRSVLNQRALALDIKHEADKHVKQQLVKRQLQKQPELSREDIKDVNYRSLMIELGKREDMFYLRQRASAQTGYYKDKQAAIDQLKHISKNNRRANAKASKKAREEAAVTRAKERAAQELEAQKQAAAKYKAKYSS